MSASCGGGGKKEDLSRVATFAGLEDASWEPFGIAYSNGGVFVSDGAGGRILKVVPGGKTEVVTDKLDTPSHIAVDSDGSILVVDSGSHTVERVGKDGSVSLVAGVANTPGYRDGEVSTALFRAPIGIAARGGKIYIADSYNDRIRVIENGKVTTLAGSVRGFADSADGNGARFNTPCGLALLPDGRLLVADLQNRRIRMVEPDGRTTTFAGTGREMLVDGELLSASFVAPTDVTAAPGGEVFVADGDAVRVIGARFFPIVETISARRRGFSDGKRGVSRFNRVSGLASGPDGELYAADSGNGLVRVFSVTQGTEATAAEFEKARSPIFEKGHEPVRWPYDPPDKAREIAGTFGEVRGERKDVDSEIYFHNGLDIVGGYGETARFVIDEKVLAPEAARNYGTLRELLRMPKMGYIHINIGRTTAEDPFDDPRFIFDKGNGGLASVRVPRGAKFRAGDRVGTLNRMNHVHLVAGPEGREVNGLLVLKLPGVSDQRTPVIESVEITDAAGRRLETESDGDRITVAGAFRIVVDAYDQMDGNADRRRLGVYKLGFTLQDANRKAVAGLGDSSGSLVFDGLPDQRFAGDVYAVGSRSGATGLTLFRYIVSNRLTNGIVSDGPIDASGLGPGNYVIEVFAEDFFGNRSTETVKIRIAQRS